MSVARHGGDTRRRLLLAFLCTLVVALPARDASATLRQRASQPDPRPASARSADDLDAEGRHEPPGRARAPGQVRVQDLLQFIERQRGGRAKVALIRAGKPGNARPASTPAGEAEGNPADPPGRRVGQTSLADLLDIIRRQPGGRDKLEAARATGRPGGPPPEVSPLRDWLAALSPFTPRVAQAQGGLVPSYGCLAAASNHWTGPSCQVKAYGATYPAMSSDYGIHLRNYLSTSSTSWGGAWGHRIEDPAIVIGFNAPHTGWYVINVYAVQTGPSMSGTWKDHPGRSCTASATSATTTTRSSTTWRKAITGTTGSSNPAAPGSTGSPSTP